MQYYNCDKFNIFECWHSNNVTKKYKKDDEAYMTQDDDGYDSDQVLLIVSTTIMKFLLGILILDVLITWQKICIYFVCSSNEK